MADEHEITRRELTEADGSYAGVLICACGWGVRVGPYRSKPLAEATLDAEWIFHGAASGEVPTPG